MTLILFISGCATSPKNSPHDKASTSASAGYKGHGAESVDAATIAKYAPPPLDPSTADPVRKMLEILPPGLGLPSPDGKTLYFTWRVTGVNQIFKLDGPLRFPIQMTSGADPTTIHSVTPDGRFLVVLRDQAGEENPGLYLLPTAGGPLTRILHKKNVQARPVGVTNGSDFVYYLANDIQPDSFALYRYSIADGTSELLFSEPGIWSVADVYWGTETFLLSKATGSRTAEFYLWKLADRKLVPVLGQGEKEEYEVAFTGVSNEYFVLTPKFSEFKRLYRFKDGKFSPLTPEVKAELETFDIDFARKYLYLSWNEGGFTRVEVRDPSSFAVVPLPKFEGAEQVLLGSVSRFGRFATFGVITGTRPLVSFVHDWKSKKMTQWVLPSLPEVDASQFVPTTIESFTARDGTRIPMLVNRPKTCKVDPCPVVVHFHGGPEGQSRPGFNVLAQTFVQAGFVFVQPNVRGSTGYGKTWLAADNGPQRLKVITDIEDAARSIRMDPKYRSKSGREPKIGVMGWSYGGYSTLMAMTRFAGAYDAGVALVGMSDLRTFLSNTAPYRRNLRASEYGDPETDKGALEKLSPVTYLDRVKAPLLIIQGISDPRVPAGEAIQIQEKLRSRGIESKLILFADEGHGTVKRDNRVLEYGHTLEFFKTHLEGK